MTRDEFKIQSNELFLSIKDSFAQMAINESNRILSKALEDPNSKNAFISFSTELNQSLTTLSFEASCDYSEKLALLLFDQFSN